PASRSRALGCPRRVLFAAWFAVFLSCAALGGRRLARRELLVSIPFLLLGLWAQRNIAIAPLATLPVAARVIASTKERLDPKLWANWIVAVSLVALALRWTTSAALEPGFSLDPYPVAAMQAVEAKGLLGKR